MTDVVNLLICMFIMVLYINVSCKSGWYNLSLYNLSYLCIESLPPISGDIKSFIEQWGHKLPSNVNQYANLCCQKTTILYRICKMAAILSRPRRATIAVAKGHIDDILPKGPYPPGLGMADRALLAVYPRYEGVEPGSYALYTTNCILSLANKIEISLLTHWNRDKNANAAISQIFFNAFTLIKMYKFRFRYHWSLFLGFELTLFQQWFRWWFGADQATSHYLSSRRLVYLGISELPSLNELNLGAPKSYYQF